MRLLLLMFLIPFFNACLQQGGESSALTTSLLAQETSKEIGYAEIIWTWNDLPSGLRKAREEDKLVLIDFWAGWCYWCIKMDTEVMNNTRVINTVMKDFVPVKIDTDLPENSGLMKTYKIIGTPAFVVLDGNGRIITQSLGFMREDEFLIFLQTSLERTK